MSDQRVKTALIGIGRWGQNVARELHAQSDLVAVVSKSDAHQDEIQKVAPHATRLSLENVCADASIHAAAVATPIDTHAEIARALLSASKHVLCEKPLATTAQEADELATLARERGLVLATGYVFMYNPAYQFLKETLSGKAIRSVDMTWKKYGTFGESIEYNLLTHHLSIAYDLLGMPERARAEFGAGVESQCDRVDTTLTYGASEVRSHIDRLSKETSHTITVRTDDASFVLEGTAVRNAADQSVLFESADTPLSREIASFLQAVSGGSMPTADIFGAEVLRMHALLH